MNPKKRLLTAKQAKDWDKKLFDNYGVPTLLLMENAGRAVFVEAQNIAKPSAKITVCCGRGNNGGDGFAAARHLLSCGYKPQIFLAGRVSELKDEAGLNAKIILRLGYKIIEVTQKNIHLICQKIKKSNLVIDALLGVGIKGQVYGITKELIDCINQSIDAYVLSVDIPSGLDADTGIPLGDSVKADKTVAFMAKKKGMVAGKRYCGAIVISNLGIPGCLF